MFFYLLQGQKSNPGFWSDSILAFETSSSTADTMERRQILTLHMLLDKVSIYAWWSVVLFSLQNIQRGKATAILLADNLFLT